MMQTQNHWVLETSSPSKLPMLIICAKSLQSCLTLCDPMDYSLPGSSVHRIFQAGVLEWSTISFSRGSSQPQGLNPGLLHCRQTLYCLSHQGSLILRVITMRNNFVLYTTQRLHTNSPPTRFNLWTCFNWSVKCY